MLRGLFFYFEQLVDGVPDDQQKDKKADDWDEGERPDCQSTNGKEVKGRDHHKETESDVAADFSEHRPFETSLHYHCGQQAHSQRYRKPYQ